MTDLQSWGPDEDGNVGGNPVDGWQMAAIMGTCLLRVGVQQRGPDGQPQRGATNLVLSADQCEEIARGLLQVAAAIRAEGGNA